MSVFGQARNGSWIEVAEQIQLQRPTHILFLD